MARLICRNDSSFAPLFGHARAPLELWQRLDEIVRPSPESADVAIPDHQAIVEELARFSESLNAMRVAVDRFAAQVSG
jgi:hypothetical protein